MIDHPPVTSAPTSCGCGKKPCRCDCDETRVACQLDCPTRPVFHCGQLLTDTHLNAITGWAAERLRLQRFRDGWGVVCGLEVNCDAETPSRVRIYPGYAIGCCGDDLVLCEETCLDLAKACAEHPGDCGDVPKQPVETKGDDTGAARANSAFAVDIVLDSAETGICYAGTKGCDPRDQKQAGQKSATDHHSVPTLVRETARPAWRIAHDDIDPAAAFAKGWHGCTDIIGMVSEQAAPSTRRQMLLGIHPRRFCALHEIIAMAKDEELNDEKFLAPILLWLVVDCRRALLDCDCYSCSVDDRVRLARVWLRRTTDDRHRRVCRLLHIDDSPSNRRLLQRDCPIERAGSVNGARLAYWRAPEDAQAALASAGVSSTLARSGEVPENYETLQTLCESGPFLERNGSYQLLYIEYPDWGVGKRVVGWSKGAVARLRKGST